MGLRLWIQTKDIPIFTLRTQWQFLNQSLTLDYDEKIWWFFQDEWESDMTLYRVAGLTKNDPHGTLQKWYYKDHMAIIDKLRVITNDQIDRFFLDQWERNVPYWDMYRLISIAYLEAKRDYVASLYNAGITATRSAFDMDEYLNSPDYPAWYEYKSLGPARILPRIPGQVVKVNRDGTIKE